MERLEQSFWGQMSSLYFFNQPLSADLVRALFELGPGYSGQFSADEAVLLPATSRAPSILFDGTLQYVCRPAVTVVRFWPVQAHKRSRLASDARGGVEARRGPGRP